jgi:hypothetical protein
MIDRNGSVMRGEDGNVQPHTIVHERDDRKSG